MKEVDNINAFTKETEETYEGEHEINVSDVEKYLGQIISSDSTNTKNIDQMYNRGIGIKNKILTILNTFTAGKYHFEVAIILRNAYLISSILYGSEVWYGITEAEILKLEKVDNLLLRQLFECSSNVPTELLFLELGILRLRDIVTMRRVMYLHHILKQPSNSLIFRFFISQLKNPKKGDWVSQVLSDMVIINLNMEIEDVAKMSKNAFKTLLKQKVNMYAFNQLIEIKNERKSVNAKGKMINYDSFKMQNYLLPSDRISILEQKWVFKCRTDDIDIKGNNRWKYEDISCVSCQLHPETQKHLIECHTLLGKNEKMTYIPTYADIFKNDVNEQSYIARIMKENFHIREKYL